MKRYILLLLSAASCTDLIHYISFDHGGQSVQVLRISVQRAYVQGDAALSAGLKSMGAFKMRSPEYFIDAKPLDTEESLGFELRYTAKEGYLALQPSGIVPERQDFGFSMVLDPPSEASIDISEAMVWLGGVKYRILLSKKGIRPLWRVEVGGYGGKSNFVSVSEFDTFYMIEFPITAWLFNQEETTINFYLR